MNYPYMHEGYDPDDNRPFFDDWLDKWLPKVGLLGILLYIWWASLWMDLKDKFKRYATK